MGGCTVSPAHVGSRNYAARRAADRVTTGPGRHTGNAAGRSRGQCHMAARPLVVRGRRLISGSAAGHI